MPRNFYTILLQVVAILPATVVLGTAAGVLTLVFSTGPDDPILWSAAGWLAGLAALWFTVLFRNGVLQCLLMASGAWVTIWRVVVSRPGALSDFFENTDVAVSAVAIWLLQIAYLVDGGLAWRRRRRAGAPPEEPPEEPPGAPPEEPGPAG